MAAMESLKGTSYLWALKNYENIFCPLVFGFSFRTDLVIIFMKMWRPSSCKSDFMTVMFVIILNGQLPKFIIYFIEKYLVQ